MMLDEVTVSETTRELLMTMCGNSAEIAIIVGSSGTSFQCVAHYLCCTNLSVLSTRRRTVCNII